MEGRAGREESVTVLGSMSAKLVGTDRTSHN